VEGFPLFRTHLLVWVAALSFTLLAAQESWAQKGPTPIGGSGSVRPAMPPNYAHPTPSYSPSLGTTKLILSSNVPHYPPSLLPANWPTTSAAWHRDAAWHHTLWDDGWYRHRRARYDPFFALAAFFHFNPWVSNFFEWSPWSPQYYWYHYFSGPPYYSYYIPSVTYHKNYYGPSAYVGPEPVVVTTAYIEVAVPDAEAKVWFGDYQTTSLGKMRFFTSPTLQPGTAYSYTIKASWDEGGQTRTAERVVYVTAGTHVVVDFTPKPPK
jgi:uncharacterized protein (TIGR03000 family)